MELPSVIYLIGYGRSGSTILNIMLGQHPDIFSAGELRNMTTRAWQKNEYCSCRNKIQSCPFWSEVMKLWLSDVGQNGLSEYARLQSQETIFQPLPEIQFQFGSKKDSWNTYLSMTDSLLAAIKKISGKNYISDSSKLPGRALAMFGHMDSQSRIIHLIRDGRGVAWSLRKAYAKDVRQGIERSMSGKSVLRTGLSWMATNLASERVCQRAGKGREIRLRYEDLVTSPEASLQSIGNSLNLSFDGVIERIKQGDALDPGHVVAGNRLRMSNQIKLTPDTGWKTALPSGDIRAFQLMCGWLQRRYGYT